LGITGNINTRLLYFRFKHRAYSPNRVKYPLKRVDWEPGGDPSKINAQNRGKSKYKRISWDEATDIVASEIKRLRESYGPKTIYLHSRAHAQCKNVHMYHESHSALLGMFGSYSTYDNNPDSWEGWFWGGEHVAGSGQRGLLTPYDNVIKDVAENTDMIVIRVVIGKQRLSDSADVWQVLYPYGLRNLVLKLYL
jgi:trimethylamine-N-oxide reductase (cytochrome c)